MYNWNHRFRPCAADRTSSVGQMDAVDSAIGTEAAAAALAAWASPRRANMPVSPTGASASGIETSRPASCEAVDTSETSRITRCRKPNRSKSETLRAWVCSSFAAPSM